VYNDAKTRCPRLTCVIRKTRKGTLNDLIRVDIDASSCARDKEKASGSVSWALTVGQIATLGFLTGQWWVCSIRAVLQANICQPYVAAICTHTLNISKTSEW